MTFFLWKRRLFSLARRPRFPRLDLPRRASSNRSFAFAQFALGLFEPLQPIVRLSPFRG
jgi:hypothetical protein